MIFLHVLFYVGNDMLFRAGKKFCDEATLDGSVEVDATNLASFHPGKILIFPLRIFRNVQVFFFFCAQKRGSPTVHLRVIPA